MIKNIRKEYELMRQYFFDSHKEIAINNLYLLKIVSIISLLVSIIFIFITPFLINTWEVTYHYRLLIITTSLFSLFALFYSNKKEQNELIINISCILFCISILVVLIIIDVFPFPDGQAVFMPLVITILPIVFILKISQIFSITGIMTFIYCLLNNYNKMANVSQSDIFCVIIAYIFSMAIYYIVMSLRVNEYKSKLKYKHLSTVDALTNLLNKGTSEQEIKNYFRINNKKINCALLVIDIDNFKHVNDKYGHAIGDKLLKEVGIILQQLFYDEDIVGRNGGDEFIILASRNVTKDNITKTANNIIEYIKNRSQIIAGEQFTCSIGIVLVNDNYVVYEELFRHVDDALYEAKSFGKGRYIIHEYYNNVAMNNDKYMLIVDDDLTSLAILTALFEDDYIVIPVNNGIEALNVLNQYQDTITVMILDLNMPEMNGYQVLKYMKSRSKYDHIPVLITTADQNSEKDVLLLGATDFLHKPIDPQIARVRVNNAVR